VTTLGSLRGLAEMAISLRRTMLGGAASPESIGAFAELLEEASGVRSTMARVLGRAAYVEELHQTHTLARWVDAGLPSFELTHSLMAALLLTDPGDVAADLVRLPFSTFAVCLPHGFWTMHAGDAAVPAGIALVHAYTAVTSRDPMNPRALLSFRIIARDGKTSTWEVREPLPSEGPIGAWIADEVPVVDDPTGVVVPPDEHDRRLAVAFRRLLVNLCLYVAQNGRGEPAGRRDAKRAGGASSPALASAWVLGREVKLAGELIGAAKAWTDSKSARAQAGEGWRLRERFTVRGHWRQQAHGPGRELRRLRWIAPYWKGEGPTFAHVYVAGSSS
jgi:hypothetical protein